jgi:hypothetical protein
VDVRDAAHAAPASSSSEDEDESDYEESDVRVVDAAPIAAMVSDNAPDDDDVETKPKKKVYKRVMKG